jgi:hypothetical protein
LLAASRQAPLLDLRPALLHGKTEQPVYWQTDTHWNSYGVYLAYAEIMAALHARAPQNWQPGLQARPLSDYAAEPVTYTGDLRHLLALDLLPGEAGLALTPRFPLQSRLVSQSGPVSILETPDPARPRLLVFHDSFGPPLIPYLAEHFSRSVFAGGLDAASAFALIHQEQPDFIILELVERDLRNLKDLARP